MEMTALTRAHQSEFEDFSYVGDGNELDKVEVIQEGESQDEYDD